MWVDHLPPDSFTVTAINGPHYPVEVQLLGAVVDRLALMSWQFGHGKGPRPKTGQWPWSKRDDQTKYGKAQPIDHVRDFLLLRNGRAPGR